MSVRADLRADLARYGPRPFLREQSAWAVAVYRAGRALDAAPHRPWTPALHAAWWLAYRAVETATGITLPKLATVGPGLRIWHFGGIVIAEGVRIGPGCTLRQNTTIGEREPGGPVPVLGADVNVGPGAQILGGVTVGDGATVGAMSLVIDDVPPGATVVGIPARELAR